MGLRPTLYTIDFPLRVSEYITWCRENPIALNVTTTEESGTPQRVKKTGKTVRSETKPRLPSFAGFCRFVDMNKSTVSTWAEQHDALRLALEELDHEQERILLEMGASGSYNAAVVTRILAAKHQYREQADLTSGGEPLKIEISDSIAKKNGLTP